MNSLINSVVFLALFFVSQTYVFAQSGNEVQSEQEVSEDRIKPLGASLRSLLVPGGGVFYATNGQKSGFSRTASVVVLLASAYGVDQYSQQAYSRYMKERNPEKVDQSYNVANMSKQMAYGLLLGGLAVWSYDVIWVARESVRNNKKRQSVSVKTSATVNSISLSYAF